MTLFKVIHPVYLAGRQIDLALDYFHNQICYLLWRLFGGVDLIHAVASLHRLDKNHI